MDSARRLSEELVCNVILVVGAGKMGLSHAALVSAYIGRDRVVVCIPRYLPHFCSVSGFRTAR